MIVEKFTLTFYQEKIALPDVINWLATQLTQNRVHKYEFNTNNFVVVLKYKTFVDEIYETVLIIPDFEIKRIKEYLQYETNGGSIKFMITPNVIQNQTIQLIVKDIIDYKMIYNGKITKYMEKILELDKDIKNFFNYYGEK